MCNNCEAELPDGARFCLRCGAPQSPDHPILTFRREICEVYRSKENGGWFRAGDTYWEAIAVGPAGRYMVARSETCSRNAVGGSSGVKQADDLLDELIRQLIQEGWQPLPRGPEWYSYRFERHLQTAPGSQGPLGSDGQSAEAPPAG
jgi:hypothetical protein